jgi:hypothetical protein
VCGMRKGQTLRAMLTCSYPQVVARICTSHGRKSGFAQFRAGALGFGFGIVFMVRSAPFFTWNDMVDVPCGSDTIYPTIPQTRLYLAHTTRVFHTSSSSMYLLYHNTGSLLYQARDDGPGAVITLLYFSRSGCAFIRRTHTYLILV